jgi:hypothetical protein
MDTQTAPQAPQLTLDEEYTKNCIALGDHIFKFVQAAIELQKKSAEAAVEVNLKEMHEIADRAVEDLK